MSRDNHDTPVSPSTSWMQLTKAFPGHPALKKPTVIALPRKLLERINELAPKFFDADDLRFERKLAACGCTGYFEGVEFTYEPLNVAPAPREIRKATPFQGLLKRQYGTRIKRPNSSSETIRAEVAQRRRAFAAWIATHPLFQKNVAQFRSRWDAPFKSQLPLNVTAAGLMNKRLGKVEGEQAFLIAYLNFCSDHSLDGLSGGYLPIPSDSALLVDDSSEANLMPKGGVLLFVPWHLLREDTIALREIVFGYGRFLLPPLVRAWVNEESDFGIERYATMLHLYMYLKLAIAQRYPAKLRGATESLDAAFGRFVRGIEPAADEDLTVAESIRKIRLRMQQRLTARVPKDLERLDQLSAVNDLGGLRTQLDALINDDVGLPPAPAGPKARRAAKKRR